MEQMLFRLTCQTRQTRQPGAGVMKIRRRLQGLREVGGG
jgi:hypothetical protein